MLTITGNGMGDYTFANLTVDVTDYDTIVCDKNFIETGERVLKLGYREAKAYILEHYREENILYVVTGSPLFFSAGVLIAQQLPQEAVRIVDNTSSLSYLLARLQLAQQTVGILSLHGRDRIDLREFLVKPYTFILCDAKTLDRLHEALAYVSPEAVEVTIGYKLGYADEVIEQVTLHDRSYRAFDAAQPYVLLIKRLFEPASGITPDGAFETERGMITKEYKRHLGLQNLDLAPNHIFWDVGAGSGSCAIDAFLRYRVRSVLFEKQALRCEYIRSNLRTHHVCDTELIEGDAERRFEAVTEDPDRICVGGGGSKVIARLPYLYGRLREEGVMLINAITLKNLTQMIAVLSEAEIAYEVISLSLTTYKGKLDMIEPQRQLFQIKIRKQPQGDPA